MPDHIRRGYARPHAKICIRSRVSMLGLRPPRLEDIDCCVWRAVLSHSSHHLQEAQLSLNVHKGGLKPLLCIHSQTPVLRSYSLCIRVFFLFFRPYRIDLRYFDLFHEKSIQAGGGEFKVINKIDLFVHCGIFCKYER